LTLQPTHYPRLTNFIQSHKRHAWKGDLSWALQWVTNWWPYGYIHALTTNLKELFNSSCTKVKPIKSINWNSYLSYSMQYSKTLLHLTRAHCNQSFCLCTSLPSTVLYTRYKTTKPTPKGKRGRFEKDQNLQFISCAILHVKSTPYQGK